MHHIISVQCDEDYGIDVLFDMDEHIHICFQKRKETIRFALLADPIFFRAVTTDGSFIRWEDKIEISVRELLTMRE